MRLLGYGTLAELTYDNSTGFPDRLNAVLCEDALRPASNLDHFYLAVRGAKTARPGVAQPILLNRQPNKLCPVNAVLRRLRTATGAGESLFGYVSQDVSRINLTRSVVVSRCQQVWRSYGWELLSGHSFRVGGASLRAALGVDHSDIQRLGRWTSDCYKLYIREYNSEDLVRSISILQVLNSEVV